MVAPWLSLAVILEAGGILSTVQGGVTYPRRPSQGMAELG